MSRCLLLLLFVGHMATAQSSFHTGDFSIANPWEQGQDTTFPGHMFTFARVRYSSLGQRWGWDTDYPESDINFSLRLGELTTIQVNRDKQGRIVHVVLDLDDDRIFNFPFLYMVEVGNLHLSDYEGERLREYLLRGGFLLVDDFWGESEWYNWVNQLDKVFPDKEAFPFVEVPLTHTIFHAVFNLDEVPQVPSVNTWVYGRETAEYQAMGEPASCHGVFDREGRLMMAVLHNTDLGDGWEREGENFEYFRLFSVARAYPLGINIVVYAMTH